MDWQAETDGAKPQSSVFDLGAAFMARRAIGQIRVADRIVIQTAACGQVEAFVMSAEPESVRVRLTRWAEVFEVPRPMILRRLPREAAA